MVPQDKYMPAPIIERKDYSPTLWSVRMRPPETLTFKAGQYVAFGLENGEKVLERAFSIVSSPYELPDLEFFIERVPDGALSPQLYELGVGQSVHMRRKAKGIFNIDVKSGHINHLLVSTVTGIAPYISYIRELHELAARYDWLRYFPTISRPWEDPEWKGERGRVDDLVRKYTDSLGLDPDNTTAYLCGNPGMIVNARGILKRRGFESQYIREETYWNPSEGEVEY